LPFLSKYDIIFYIEDWVRMKVGILLFKKKKSNINISEYNDVLSFNQIVTNLLAQDKFIAKS